MSNPADGRRITDATLDGRILYRVQGDDGECRRYVEVPGHNSREVPADEYEALLSEAVDGSPPSDESLLDAFRFPAQ